jgi:hypothetical protein
LKYQSPSTYHSKVTAKVKVFGGRQKDRNTDRTKTIPLPIFDLVDIKINTSSNKQHSIYIKLTASLSNIVNFFKTRLPPGERISIPARASQ